MSKLLSDYDYTFPPELVAQEPLPERDASRMMVVSRSDQRILHSQFRKFPEFLHPGDLVVVNDTSVLACRLFAQKPTGGKVEVFLLKEETGKRGDGETGRRRNGETEKEWAVFFSPVRGLREGMRLKIFSREKNIPSSDEIIVTSLRPDDFRISFDDENAQNQILSEYGEMPLPPYIERSAPRSEDRERYQTAFAKNPGAVAAPTAGLHFTPAMRQALQTKGVAWATVTLHVGPGTFLPVKTENIEGHRMHSEFYEIPSATLDAIQSCRAQGGKILAVGTTSLRALESWALTGKASAWTDLFIRPRFSFQVVDQLLTNFHQPKSTLLMLVSAFASRELIHKAYREAIDRSYRLFSYGDCMLIA